MLGIPTETDDDIKAFINLAKKIKAENKGFEITFSFSTFVPKPQTPLQWAKREDTKSLEKKQKFLEKEFRKMGVDTKFSSPKWDYWQTILSRGDDTLTKLLIYAYENGGKNNAYKKAFKEFCLNDQKMIEGFYHNETLPWEFIDNYLNKELLLSENKRLQKYS